MTDTYDGTGGGATGQGTLETLNLSLALAGEPAITLAEYKDYIKGPAPFVLSTVEPDWVADYQYAVRDAVRHAGSTWAALQSTIGVQPGTNEAVWWQVTAGADIAFAEQTKAEVAALGDQKVLEVATIGNEKIAEAQVQVGLAQAQVGLASTARVGSETARSQAQAAQAAAEAAALTMGAVAYATAAALPGAPAANAKGYVYADLTPANNGLWFWGAAGPWTKDTLSPASAADLLAEAEARQALVNGDDEAVGHIIRNALGFWLAQFAEDGGIWSKFLRISPDGASMDFIDPHGFHIASIGSDGITIKGGVTHGAIPGPDWIVADPYGFHLIAVIDGRLYVKGREVGPSNTAALAESAPEVELLRTGIRRPACTDLPHWRAARARVLQGIGGARIVALGDSLTAGGSTEAGSLQAAAYPTMLARLLGSVYGAGPMGFMGGKYGSGISAYDPRITLGAGWTAVEASTVAVLGGQAIENNTTTNAFTFAPGQAWDTAEVYVAGIGVGSLSLSIGGAATNYNPTVGAVTKIIYTAASLGAHTLTIARVSGDVQVLGIICTDSTTPAVTVINAARGGYEVGDYLDSTDFYSPANVLPTLDADLFLVEIGINNRNADLAPASYRSQLDALLALLPADADVLLIASASPAPGGLTYAWSEYVAQMNEAAAVIGTPFFDLTIAMGDRATIEAQGWNSDGVHLTRAGLAEKAHIIHKLLTA